jgi:hypothetical protein|tara:strand:+ start:331 stop:543 length:213 start_codon:yes stop_codon:yes gene_type:complete
MQTIYKCTRYCDNDLTEVSYSTSRDYFDQQHKEDIDQGFGTSNDVIEKITFKNIDDLCDKIGVNSDDLKQ